MRSLRSPLPIRPLRVRGLLGGALAALLVAQPRQQHRHRLGLVAVLAAVVLAFGHQPGGQVGDADRAVGLVDVLAAGAAGAEGVDAQLGRVQRAPPRPRRARASPPPCRRWCGCGPGSRWPARAARGGRRTRSLQLAVDARRPRCAAPAPCSRRVRPALSLITSVRQPWRSQKRRYMRARSPANSADSSPPVPARISRKALRSSSGSRGSSAACSSACRRCHVGLRRRRSPRCAISAISGSLGAASRARRRGRARAAA